jgi:arginine-tRNA-protein transferase
VTAPSPCPYLENREERKIFTDLNIKNPNGLHNSLAEVGFRRSQDIIYRPACEGCNQCKSVRLPAVLFQKSKSQKRVWNKNRDIVIEMKRNIPTMEQYELLHEYLTVRHDTGGMADMDFFEYQEMVTSSPIHSVIIEYRLKDKLIGVALTDEISSGFSMVYSFYDISAEMSLRSLGTFFILHHIKMVRTHKLDFLYLGYYVKNSPKMSYKRNFMPLEVLNSSGWELVPK